MHRFLRADQDVNVSVIQKTAAQVCMINCDINARTVLWDALYDRARIHPANALELLDDATENLAFALSKFEVVGIHVPRLNTVSHELDLV